MFICNLRFSQSNPLFNYTKLINQNEMKKVIITFKYIPLKVQPHDLIGTHLSPLRIVPALQTHPSMNPSLQTGFRSEHDA